MMISVDAPNHYEVLGVANDATPDEIRAAHRRLVHQVHTDKGGTDALFRQVQAAYEALSDPDSRAAYDRQLRAASTGSGFDDNAPGWRSRYGWGIRTRLPGLRHIELESALSSRVTALRR